MTLPQRVRAAARSTAEAGGPPAPTRSVQKVEPSSAWMRTTSPSTSVARVTMRSRPSTGMLAAADQVTSVSTSPSSRSDAARARWTTPGTVGTPETRWSRTTGSSARTGTRRLRGAAGRTGATGSGRAGSGVPSSSVVNQCSLPPNG